MATIEFLKSAKRQFQYYKSLGDKAMAQVEDQDLNWQPNDTSMSISAIVKHLHGNMLSRWTDLLTTDGEKPTRNREAEFDNDISGRDAILQRWEEGWKCLFDALEGVTDDGLDTIIYIRNEGHTVLEAINRQLAHYPYHIGQIVFIAKMLRNHSWESLSIPRGKSNEYNADKFSREKGMRHFTDSELKK